MVQHKIASPQEREIAQLVAEMYALLRPEYDEDMTHQSVRVLQHISMATEPLRVDDVRRFLGGAATSASEFVKRLAVKGLVTRRRSEQDERVVELALTERGEHVLRQHTQLDVTKLEAAFRDAPGANASTMVRMLRLLVDAARQTAASAVAERPALARGSEGIEVESTSGSRKRAKNQKSSIGAAPAGRRRPASRTRTGPA